MVWRKHIPSARVAHAGEAAPMFGLGRDAPLSISEQARDGIAEHDPAAMFDPNPFSAYTGVRMGNAAV